MIGENELLQLQQRVQHALSSYDWGMDPKTLSDPVEYVISLGGKRLRPMLCLLACKLYGDDESMAIKASMGLEVFHNFTLLHDDIMDRADTRRGQLTVHKKWNDSAAILSGDAMLIKAYQLMSEVPESVAPVISRLFSQTALEVCEGQQLDMDYEGRQEVGIPDYIRMIRLKTAVLLGASLKIGAILGGADTFNQDKMYEFGIQLGLAFQLRDDYLDAFGDPRLFGKKIGGDICCNKKTFLLLTALKNATGADRDELLEALSLPIASQSDEKIRRVLAVYRKVGVVEATLEAIRKYDDMAMACIASLDISDEGKELLGQIASELAGREH